MHSRTAHPTLEALLILALLLPAGGARAAAPPWERFYGEYTGTAISDNDEDLGERDIHVRIAPAEGGFNVSWTAVVRKDDGKLKRSEFSIDFRPTRRERIYSAAMRKDVFGNAVPLNPLAGEPYVWARIRGDTLTVYALLITESGGYEMQVYDRTLVPGGMKLRYSRVRDGENRRTVTGWLQRRP